MEQNKKKHPQLGSEVLQALFENGKSELSIHFIRWKLWKQWDEYVGKTIAQVSEPVSYVKGVLYVWVKNSAWMQQMVFMREPMKDAINKKLQKSYVKEIRLTLDKKAIPNDEQGAQELRDSLSSLMKESDQE